MQGELLLRKEWTGLHTPCKMLCSWFLDSILQTAHLWANTGVVFRELSFSRLECGVHDRLHIYPLCGIFYFPWHRHQIEGTNGFYCLIRKTERFTISNVESQVFNLIIHAWTRDRTRAARVTSECPTTGLTAPPLQP